MKRIFTLTTLLLLFAIAFTACQKIEKDTPQAIKKLIKEYNKSGACVSVTEYKYNEKKIYCFKENDSSINIYDKNGNLLCISGGFVGKTCEEYTNSIVTRIIWTKK